MKSKPLSVLFACVTILGLGLFSFGEKQERAATPLQKKNPVEIGTVQWERDFGAAKKASVETGKPMFVLFQEVPGCAGCRKFGQDVLSDKRMVAAIEEGFVPVVVYNNQPGKDKELLKVYNEPAWNYQVVRFLDASGKDIIPRKDRVWTLNALVARSKVALEKAKAPVPVVLDGLVYAAAKADLKEAVFSMHCFWTGEMKLGGIEGVVYTEAGFFDGREVTRVWFDADRISLQGLVDEANRINCANRVYFAEAKEQQTIKAGKLGVGLFKASGYRPAPEKDQKKQLQGTPWADRAPTEYQRTKLNAFCRKDRKKAETYASAKRP